MAKHTKPTPKKRKTPAKLERCVQRVKEQGKSKSSAFAICQSSINKKKKRK